MVNREKVKKGLDLCLTGEPSTCKDCPYDAECKEARGIGLSPLRRDALELLKENDIELERIYQNICTYINGGCSTDTEADKQHVCEMIGRIFCAGGRIVLTSGVEAQGKWIHNGMGEYHCTICGEVVYLDNGSPIGEGYKYCPFCGARMDEEEKQNAES